MAATQATCSADGQPEVLERERALGGERRPRLGARLGAPEHSELLSHGIDERRKLQALPAAPQTTVRVVLSVEPQELTPEALAAPDRAWTGGAAARVRPGAAGTDAPG